MTLQQRYRQHGDASYVQLPAWFNWVWRWL